MPVHPLPAYVACPARQSLLLGGGEGGNKRNLVWLHEPSIFACGHWDLLFVCSNHLTYRKTPGGWRHRPRTQTLALTLGTRCGRPLRCFSIPTLSTHIYQGRAGYVSEVPPCNISPRLLYHQALHMWEMLKMLRECGGATFSGMKSMTAVGVEASCGVDYGLNQLALDPSRISSFSNCE